MSASTHIPPTGTHCPLSTLAVMRANSSGWRSSIHAYCWACEQANRYSGCSSISRTADANVRVALASRLADRPQPGGVDVRVAGGDDPMGARPGRQSAERRLRPRGGRPRRRGRGRGRVRASRSSRAPARIVERERAHQPVEHVEVVHQRLGLGVDDAPGRRAGTGTAAPRRPCRATRAATGGTAGTTGSRPPRRVSTSGPGCGVDGDVRAPRMDPLDRPSGVVDGRGPRTGTRRRRGGSRGRSPPRPGGRPTASGSRRSGGTTSSPTAHPTSNRRRSRSSRSSVGPASIAELRPVGLDERNDPLPQLARDASFHERPVVVHPTHATQPPPELSASDGPVAAFEADRTGFQARVTAMASGPRRPAPIV